MDTVQNAASTPQSRQTANETSMAHTPIATTIPENATLYSRMRVLVWAAAGTVTPNTSCRSVTHGTPARPAVTITGNSKNAHNAMFIDTTVLFIVISPDFLLLHRQ